MKGKIVLLFLVLNVQVFACINFYGESVFGEEVTIEGYIVLFDKMRTRLQDSSTFLQSKVDLLNSNFSTKESRQSVSYLNDFAAIKIYQGQYKEAILILKKLLKSNPNEYQINANLGVAYELIGKVDSAYFYTEQAIRINPRSHRGTEWLHLLILKANDKLKNDSLYYYSHYITGETISTSQLPERNFMRLEIDTTNGTPATIAKGWAVSEILMSFEHQLQERMIFVKPQNTVVANLLFTLADFYAADIDYFSAQQIYRLAEKYDSGFSTICKVRLAAIANLNAPAKASTKKLPTIEAKQLPDPNVFYSILASTVVGVCLIFFLRRNK